MVLHSPGNHFHWYGLYGRRKLAAKSIKPTHKKQNTTIYHLYRNTHFKTWTTKNLGRRPTWGRARRSQTDWGKFRGLKFRF